ncbi:hypothetical protein AB0J72_42780 [Dactylosporangium sp. NPDC049742]|uniref:hypothetical protein n=1 Tax=Dactylosporangium sp. NPDC049742 TaxID=3154737 RepID=UPI00343F7E52
MTHEQATAALRGVLEVGSSQGWWKGTRQAEFGFERFMGAAFNGSAVTAYYDETIGLAAVAVNALFGPQVTLAGMRLVGRTPSQLEDEFVAHAQACGAQIRYSQSADPCSPQLGVVLRVQRAGDLVLSRPVLVAPGWTDRCWDTSECPIPRDEWTRFDW